MASKGASTTHDHPLTEEEWIDQRRSFEERMEMIADYLRSEAAGAPRGLVSLSRGELNTIASSLEWSASELRRLNGGRP